LAQIDAASEVKRAGDSGVLIVSRWFATTARILPAAEAHANER
jgi:hypothetical protein